MTNRNIKILVIFIYVLTLFILRYGFMILSDSVTMLLLITGLVLLLMMSRKENR